MKRYLGLFLLVWSGAVFAVQNAVVKIPVANMFKFASAEAPVLSQAIYNQKVKILNAKGAWSKVQTADRYIGWMQKKQLLLGGIRKAQHNAKVFNLFAHIYREPDIGKHKPIITLPFATSLPIIKRVNAKWLQVRLLSGQIAYVQQGDVRIDPAPLSLSQMLQLSRQFIDLPYTWGGVSSYGVDCSGFVQMLFKQMGILLPRDAREQVNFSGFAKVNLKQLQPGDVIYFGSKTKVSHVGIYLGDNKFINATTYKKPMVQISDLQDKHWHAPFIAARRLKNTSAFQSSITPLPEAVKAQMRKYTWHKGCPVSLDKLAYLRLSYWGYDNKVHMGALIVNKYLAEQVEDIFHDMFNKRFPIQSMKPMYVFKGNDDASMIANNTSAFSCRTMTDFPDKYSVHSFGGAIDINPLVNPYVYGDNVQPEQGRKYLDRNANFKGKISIDSFVVQDFNHYGWIWGGSWPNMKDYQHFEKPLRRK